MFKIDSAGSSLKYKTTVKSADADQRVPTFVSVLNFNQTQKHITFR